MRPPSGGQARRSSRGKPGVIENELGFGSLLVELESRYRVQARRPIFFAPGLDDALVGNQFDVTAKNDASEDRERSAHIWTDLCRSAFQDEVSHLAELLFLGERLVDPLRRGLENDFLMDAFARI